MDYLVLLACLLTVVAVLSTRFAQRFGVPALVLFVGIGMLAGSSGPGGIQFADYSLSLNLGLLALAVILFSGGLGTRYRLFRASIVPAGLLATVGVVLKMLLIGAVTWLVSPFGFLEGLLLGAILAPTDAAAVFSVLKGRGLPARLRGVLETESGTNDPVSIYLTMAVAGMITAGSLDLGGVVLGVVVQLFLGALLGWLGGVALTSIVNRVRIPSYGLYPILALAGALLVYAGTNIVGGNGFLAIYITGLVMSNRPLSHGHDIDQFMDGVAWGAQIAMFVLLGLLVFPDQLVSHLPLALFIAAFLMLVARPLSVWLTLLPLQLITHRFAFTHAYTFDRREIALLSWAGLKGAVPIILAIVPLLERVPNGGLLFNIVFVVVIVGTAVQGSTVVPLAKWLGLLKREPPEPPVRLELGGAAPPGTAVFDVFLEPDAPAAGRTIGELSLPEEVVVAAISRGDRMISPRGGVRFESGDHVFVITTSADEQEIPRAFRSTARSSDG